MNLVAFGEKSHKNGLLVMPSARPGSKEITTQAEFDELDSVETVRKLVAFYVEQHNSHVPHSAFKGWQTPIEMYFSKGAEVPEQLKVARLAPIALNPQLQAVQNHK